MAVHDLVVKDDDLVVGTHGRSIWILDDLHADPRAAPTTVAGEPVHLFPPADAVRWRYGVEQLGRRAARYSESAARRVDLLLR